MSLAKQLDDEAYAVAKAFAEHAHCSISSAVSQLVLKSGLRDTSKEQYQGNPSIRFPLAHGTQIITSKGVALLEGISIEKSFNSCGYPGVAELLPKVYTTLQNFV